MTPTVWVIILVALVLSAGAGFAALRIEDRRVGSLAATGFFVLAGVLAIVAILSVTFFRKTVSA